jgi:hypothetical protein
MTHPGSDQTAPGAQPTPPQGAPQERPAASGGKKWIGVAGAVVVAGIGGAYLLTGGFGIGAPAVGDCIETQGTNDFSVVGCDAEEAEYEVVGIEDEKLTESGFMEDPDTCADFPTAEAAFWEATGMITEKGTVYCVGPL